MRRTDPSSPAAPTALSRRHALALAAAATTAWSLPGGVSAARADTRAEPSPTEIADRPIPRFTYDPASDPLRTFYAARDQRAQRRCTIVTLGNSLTEGTSAPTPFEGYPGQTMHSLRDQFPTPAAGGLGYVPARYVIPNPSGPLWRYPGTVVKGTQHGIGRRVVPLAGAGTATLAGPAWSHVKIAWWAVARGDSITVQVDAGAAVTVTAESPGPKTWSSATYASAAARTIRVAAVAGKPELEGAWLFDGDVDRGIHVLNGGHHGSIAGSFSVATGVPAANSVWSDSLLRYDPALVTVSFHTNDPAQRTATQFRADLAAVVNLLRTKTAAPILLMAEFERQTMPAGRLWDDYTAAIAGVAADNRSRMVDFLDVGQYIPKLSGTGGADPYGWLATDRVHLTRAGYGRWAALLTAKLAATAR
ncbi:SGNH/GDSL hydrolase family protein [Auraticoccus monumenti]|uniref:Lysophospholipase L1 n=1 Tax=Auraticoccus monumenti TaxID=675864 RepID=A0A1G7BIZ4_9ACTN|nr:SGNH/GDSL hydrolase family protein [Auraticoccus monumenti]SDE26902.1 Lysophospholipase L1 [Auraticoccus monumenti]